MLVQAIRATFDRRKTKLPTGVPLALTQEFAILKTGQWNAFVQRNKLSAEPFPRFIEAIHTFAAPPLLASSAGQRFPPIGRLEATGRQCPKSKELSLSDILYKPLATKSA